MGWMLRWIIGQASIVGFRFLSKLFIVQRIIHQFNLKKVINSAFSSSLDQVIHFSLASNKLTSSRISSMYSSRPKNKYKPLRKVLSTHLWWTNHYIYKATFYTLLQHRISDQLQREVPINFRDQVRMISRDIFGAIKMIKVQYHQSKDVSLFRCHHSSIKPQSWCYICFNDTIEIR